MAELAACLEPIAGGAGLDARFDVEHERIRAEIDKLSHVDGARPAWDEVARLAASLLRERSKDLSIASYLVAAELELRGLEGLADGLQLLRDLIGTFGDTLFPTRARARGNALLWLLERVALASSIGTFGDTLFPTRARARGNALLWLLERAAERLEGWPIELASATRAAQAAQELAAIQPWDDVAPSLSTLQRGLERARLRVPAPTLAPPAPELQQPPNPPPPSADPRDDAEAHDWLLAHNARLVDVARARFQADSSQPRPYRWLRQGLWLAWESAPPERRPGRTGLSSPSLGYLTRIEQALEEQHWEDALGASEDALASFPHWLDLNVLSLRALAGLGETHRAACAVVEQEVRALHARLPLLSERSYVDGTPFASDATRAWLHEASVPAAVMIEEGERRAFRERRELAEKLRAQGQHERASLVYWGLLADVDTYGLERWEPSIAIDVLRALCELSGARTPAGVKDADSRALYVRLARLAPMSVPVRDQHVGA